MNNKIAVLYTTVSNKKQAEDLANLVLLNNLAVCANIMSNGKSIYLWHGKIEENEESYIIFKTTVNKLPLLKDFMIKNHPYEVPAILTFKADSSEDFLNYVTNLVF